MSAQHTPTPWCITREGPFGCEISGDVNNVAYCSAVRNEPAKANAEHIVLCVNAHDDLVAAAQAAIEYDAAIAASANDPEKMASFCSAQGDDLDTLYDRWINLSRAALAKVAP